MLGDFEDLDPQFEYVFQGPHESGVFRLFDLPTELWIKICAFAVLHPSAHSRGIIDISRARRNEDQEQLVKQPAITRTCRLLRLEALPLFYRNNEFEAFHWARVSCIRQWLVAIGPTNLRNMGTLVFYAKFEPDFWVDKFEEIGIPVHVEVREDAATQKGLERFKPLMIKFL